MKINFISAIIWSIIGGVSCFLVSLLVGYEDIISTIIMYVSVIVLYIMGTSINYDDSRKTTNIRTLSLTFMFITLVANFIMMFFCEEFKIPLAVNILLLVSTIAITRGIYKNQK